MRTVPDSAMAPDASPGQQSKAGVRRVNNLPLYLIGGSMGVFLLIMASVAATRGQQQSGPAARSPEKTGNTAALAKAITGDRTDGFIPPAAPPAVPSPPASAESHPGLLSIVRPENPDLPPLPPNTTLQQPAQSAVRAGDDDAQRIRTMKLQQFDEAVKARSRLQLGARTIAASTAHGGVQLSSRDETVAKLAAVRQQIDAAAAGNQTDAYKAHMQLLRGAADGAQVDDSSTQPPPAGAGRNDVGRFAGGEQDRWRLESQPEAPRTPYELRAGFVVPAILISGINSELPGQIMAQVSRDVYDTPRGKWKLIPQGARLVGTYASEVAYGQSRVLIAWQRIVFPDGKAMDIGAMPGADAAGYAGFKDQVNNHYWRTFSSAFLMSAVTAGIATSQPENTGVGRPSFSSAMGEAVGQQLGQVTAQLIAKNLNIAPTLEIRPGYRFNVIVTKDMTFTKPYQPFDY
jgi:type IV secretory pathway VirB10-like protein